MAENTEEENKWSEDKALEEMQPLIIKTEDSKKEDKACKKVREEGWGWRVPKAKGIWHHQSLRLLFKQVRRMKTFTSDASPLDKGH